MLTLANDIATLVGLFISVTAALGIIIKPLRRLAVDWILRNTDIGTHSTQIAELRDKMCIVVDSLESMRQSNERNQPFMEQQKKAQAHLIGNSVMAIYDRYRDQSAIPIDVKDDLIETFALYTSLGGNGKIKMRYEELMKKNTM